MYSLQRNRIFFHATKIGLIYKAECNVMSHSVSPIHVGHIHVSPTDYYYYLSLFEHKYIVQFSLNV